MTYPLTTSGTTSFTVKAQDVVNYAFRKMGVLELGATADSNATANALFSLEIIIKNLIVKGSKLWTIQELVLPCVAGQTTYNLGPTGVVPASGSLDLATDKPLLLMQAWIRNNTSTPPNDIPLMVISQYDYNTLGNKGSSGTPNSVELQVLRDYSVLKSYVTPDTFAQANYTYHLLVKRTLQDVTSLTNNFDLPQEWLLPLGWLLAAELCPDWEVPPNKTQMIEMKAAKYLAEVEDFDVETASIFFTPASRWYR